MKRGIINLGDGYGLIVPKETSNRKIMIATGMLLNIWLGSEIEFAKNDPEKVKAMAKEYCETIIEKVLK